MKLLSDIVSRIRDFFFQLRLDYFETYIVLRQSNEHIFIGRRLWHLIRQDIKGADEVNIFFKKYPICDIGRPAYEYLMFVNPDLDGITDPEGEPPFTAPLQFSQTGRLGIQSVQPTPAEIIYEYRIKPPFYSDVYLRVKPIQYNGGRAYVLLRDAFHISK